MSFVARWMLWFALAMAGVTPAAAHTRSESHSNWQIDGRAVRLAFTVPATEARRLAPLGQTMPSEAALGRYLAGNVGATADGRQCQQVGQPTAVAAVQGVLRYEFLLDCPSGQKIKVRSSAFFALVPSHTNFAQIQTSDGNFIEQLITVDNQTLDVSADAGGALANAGFVKYVALGVLHIFTGVDHQVFLIGLILLSRRFRDLAFVITGFTLGHSATLALAVTGVLRPHAEYIDALIGLTIALVGGDNLAERSGRSAIVVGGVIALMAAMLVAKWLIPGGLPGLLLLGGGLFSASYLVVAGHLRDAVRVRLVVTLVFGLVHGFGFAADLLEMKLPTARLAELLVGFNLGVEIGQLAIVTGVLLIVATFVRLRIEVPRALVANLTIAILIGTGLYWFVGRSYA